MPTAAQALLQFEAGQNAFAQQALTDSGDAKTFTSAATLWSRRTGFEPVLRPNGLLTGGAVTAAVSGSNNVVDVQALTCNLNGAVVSVSAGVDLAVTRATPTDTHIINSITVNSSGALAVVVGTDGLSFSETRGADGGPPFIPTGSIEIAQVRMSSNVAAPVAADRIFSVIGVHSERADFPVFTEDTFNARVIFASSLPLIHTGSVPKAVFASFADPIFADVALASDFVPPENSVTVNSTEIYGRTLGSTSRTLNQGSFTAFLNDGVTDPLVKQADQNLWFKFFPDRNKVQHILAQGILGIARTFPAGDNIQAACTISASEVARGVET